VEVELPDSLLEIRERLHRKSHEYFAFDYDRREDAKWRMFYGATDALLDAGTAAAGYGRAIAAHPGAKLLICYGFLQALFVQQDAVATLSRAVELDWRPKDDERLREIRDTRNRLSGHPARAGENEKPPRISSAIIPDHDINQNGFRGHVYYDDMVVQVDVDVSLFLNDNQERLVIQLRKIELMMDETERQFRTEQAARPFSRCFENGFSYLVQRLHCDLANEGRVSQAQSHGKMIYDALLGLKQELVERGFKSATTSYHLERIFTGLDLLNELMNNGRTSSKTQHEFDLIYDGIETNINALRNVFGEIDARLRTPVP
jgi:hypothetical protein